MTSILQFLSASEVETRRLGAALGAGLNPGDVLCLVGDIGSGKTRLAQGIGEALAVDDILTSPTFSFINEYRGALLLMHADLYRIEHEAEMESLGLEEYFDGDWVCVIEWSDRAPRWMPAERLDIAIQDMGGTGRIVRLDPHGMRYDQLCEVLRQSDVFGH